jgi:ERF superfamily
METSPEIKNIAKALNDWHAKAITVTKDAINPHFRSKFTSLDNMIESIRHPLVSCGLSFAQFPDGDGLTTILIHTSGEWLKSTANLKLAKEDPQGQGSAYTYGRRYALAAMLGLAADEDDDGNAATTSRNAVQKPATATKRSTTTKVPTTDLLAAKDRVRTLLKLLGHDCKTKADYENTVFDITDRLLTDENLDAINEKLSALLEAKEAQE